MRSTIFSVTVAARGGGGRGDQRLDHIVLVVLVIGDERGVERLRQLRAVAVERVGLQRQLPGQHVGVLAVLDGRVVGHVDGLGDGARDEGLRRRHHADVALDREVALADLAAGIGAVEHRQVLGLEEAARLRASSRRRHGCWRPRCPSSRSRAPAAGRSEKSLSCSSVKPKRLLARSRRRASTG